MGPTLITDADNGTIGSYPPGQTTNSTAPSAPYPGVTLGFTYTVDPEKPDDETGTGKGNTVTTVVLRHNYEKTTTDLIESVTKEQAALSNLVNAEGAKFCVWSPWAAQRSRS